MRSSNGVRCCDGFGFHMRVAVKALAKMIDKEAENHSTQRVLYLVQSSEHLCMYSKKHLERLGVQPHVDATQLRERRTSRTGPHATPFTTGRTNPVAQASGTQG